jgi:YHS domain-containing protein
MNTNIQLIRSDLMKTLKTFAIALSILAILSVAALADDNGEKAKTETPKELKNQTHCPVMGGKIDSAVFTDIQGQRVYHCCPGCQEPLKKNPDKFFKKAAAEGVLFENIQTTCPVSGHELEEKKIFADFEGRRIYFCCEKCPVKFEEDPQSFLTKMDPKTEEDEENSHEGHNH